MFCPIVRHILHREWPLRESNSAPRPWKGRSVTTWLRGRKDYLFTTQVVNLAYWPLYYRAMDMFCFILTCNQNIKWKQGSSCSLRVISAASASPKCRTDDLAFVTFYLSELEQSLARSLSRLISWDSNPFLLSVGKMFYLLNYLISTSSY